jgi:hypothetical protein
MDASHYRFLLDQSDAAWFHSGGHLFDFDCGLSDQKRASVALSQPLKVRRFTA